MKPSGIGGQAVIEGIMMKNPKKKTALAVRKPDKTIDISFIEEKRQAHNPIFYPIFQIVILPHLLPHISFQEAAPCITPSFLLLWHPIFCPIINAKLYPIFYPILSK